MGGGLIFPICAFFISLVVCFAFFFKKHIDTEETKIYTWLIATNLIGIILEISCSLGSILYNSFPVISNIIFKLYLAYLVTWITIFGTYIFIISHDKEYLQKIQNKAKKILTIFYWFSIIIVFVLPIELVTKENFTIRYTAGASVDFTYLYSAIIIGIIFYCIFKNLKNIISKKYVPVLAFIVIGSIAAVVQNIHPEILLMTTVETYIILLMYFTIENPDLKFIEELSKNRELIEQSIEDKSNLLFEISQEVRKPLNKIKDLSEEILSENDLDKIHDNIKIINNETKQTSLIIDNILDISNINPKSIKENTDTYNPRSLFKENILRVTNQLNENVKLESFFSDTLPKELYGDSIKLKQVTLSLLENSIKFTSKGLIELKVDCIIKYDICRLMITVEDTGCGMSLEQINDILNSEYDITNKEISKHLEKLHLDLKLINQIVKNAGGVLLIKSDLNKGTKITIILDQKIKKDDFADNQIMKNIAEKYLNINKIVLVNDKTQDIKKIKQALKDYDLTTTMYGKDLIYRIKNGENFKLIILDDEMKPDSGYATFKELQKIKGFKTPVIILLKKEKESIKEHYIEDGFTDYILLENLNNEIKKIDKYI